MDLLRSCYEADFRFFQGSQATTRGSWFFAPLGAVVYPSAHRFGSQNYRYQPAIPYKGIGEQAPQNASWRNGSNPWGYVGLEAKGDAGQFLNGLPGVPSDYPIATEPDGTCPACFGLTTGAYDIEYGYAWDRLRKA